MDAIDRATQFARISRELLAQKDEPMTLERIVGLANDAIPGCDWAGISLRVGSSPAEPAASTDPLVHEADRLQNHLGEGPCLDSSLAGQTYIAQDTRHDPRWPQWGAHAADLGILSVLSVQLQHIDNTPIGAVNLYAGQVGAFTQDDVDLAHAFAAHAAAALEATREVSGLRAALQSRHLIGVAQGMLMQRYGLDMDQAFAVLLRHSQDSNTKLRDVAAEIVRSGRFLDDEDNVSASAGAR